MFVRRILKIEDLEGIVIPTNLVVEYNKEYVGKITDIGFLPAHDVEVCFNITEPIANLVPIEEMWLVDLERGLKWKLPKRTEF